jgi:hypothetical protein
VEDAYDSGSPSEGSPVCGSEGHVAMTAGSSRVVRLDFGDVDRS